MKIRKISLFGFLLGGIVLVSSYVQWFIKYQDLSQLIFGVSIGLIICVFSYIYSFMKDLKRDFKETDEALGKRYDLLWNEIEKLKGGEK